jgi:hypothetical protein
MRHATHQIDPQSFVSGHDFSRAVLDATGEGFSP